MTLIRKICDVLQKDDYQPVLAEVEDSDPALLPALVPFRPDEIGREFALFIQVMPTGAQDQVSVISFSLLYPFPIEEDAPVSETIRTLLLLNRFLPIGSHEFCERTPAIHYRYSLVVRSDGLFPDSVITETVGMIGYFTRQHGDFIRRVLAGEATSDELLQELQENGLDLPPIISSDDLTTV